MRTVGPTGAAPPGPTVPPQDSCWRKSGGSYGVGFISSGKVSSSLCRTAPLPFLPPPPRAQHARSARRPGPSGGPRSGPPPAPGPRGGALRSAPRSPELPPGHTDARQRCGAAGRTDGRRRVALTHPSRRDDPPGGAARPGPPGKGGQRGRSSAAAERRPFLWVGQSNLKGGKTTALYILHYSRKMVNEAPEP